MKTCQSRISCCCNTSATKSEDTLYSKNTTNIFSANCDSFLWISPASHHNFLRISSELSSEVCEDYRTCLKISSEWTNQNFSRNLSRYQPQTLGISSGFSDTSPEDQHKFLRMSHDSISPKFSEDNIRNLL
jgi:hypothetical protein